MKLIQYAIISFFAICIVIFGLYGYRIYKHRSSHTIPSPLSKNQIDQNELSSFYKSLDSAEKKKFESCMLNTIGETEAKMYLSESNKDKQINPQLLSVLQSCLKLSSTPALSSDSSTSETHVLHRAPPGNRFIRIRVFGDSGKWHLTGKGFQFNPLNRAGPFYTPDDVIAVSQDLKPDVFERFFSGSLDLNKTLEYYDNQSGAWIQWQDSDTTSNFPRGSIGSFMVQVMQHAADGAYIIPRIDGRFYDKKGSQEFYNESNELYQNLVSLGIPSDKRFLSIDNWGAIYGKGDQTKIDEVLTTLYAQGWAGIGITDLGKYNRTINTQNKDDSPTFAQINVDTHTWLANADVLSQLHHDPVIQKNLLYIDFPWAMWSYIHLDADKQAEILETLAANQIYDQENSSQTGYTVVYNIAQWRWDAKKEKTSNNGAYKGKSIYNVIRTLLSKYNE